MGAPTKSWRRRRPLSARRNCARAGRAALFALAELAELAGERARRASTLRALARRDLKILSLLLPPPPPLVIVVVVVVVVVVAQWRARAHFARTQARLDR